MKTKKKNRQAPRTLWLDDSPESQAALKLIQEAGVSCDVFDASPSDRAWSRFPQLQERHGVHFGLESITAYVRAYIRGRAPDQISH